MIEAKEGAVSVKGTSVELLADLSTAVRAVKETLMETEKEEFVKKQIDYAVKIGLMNDSQFEKEVKEKGKKVVSKFIDDLLGGLFDEDK
jgi:hypothetical protein